MGEGVRGSWGRECVGLGEGGVLWALEEEEEEELPGRTLAPYRRVDVRVFGRGGARRAHHSQSQVSMRRRDSPCLLQRDARGLFEGGAKRLKDPARPAMVCTRPGPAAHPALSADEPPAPGPRGEVQAGALSTSTGLTYPPGPPEPTDACQSQAKANTTRGRDRGQSARDGMPRWGVGSRARAGPGPVSGAVKRQEVPGVAGERGCQNGGIGE